MSWKMLALLALCTTFGVAARQARALDVQGLEKEHRDYANVLYKFVTREGKSYKTWTEGKSEFEVGPQADEFAKSYLNSIAAASNELPNKSCVVTEHFADGDLTGITVRLNGPDGDTLLAYVAAKDGFETFIDDGRVWVFRSKSKELEDFKKDGEPAKIVVRPGAGPNGATVKAANNETIDAYLK